MLYIKKKYHFIFFKELERFARFIFRQFAECAVQNPKAYMELFFWKSTKLAREMVDGYDADICSSRKKVSANTWTEAEEDELRTLFMEHQTKKPHQGKHLYYCSIKNYYFLFLCYFFFIFIILVVLYDET